MSDHFFVVTGGPGAGKTSLITELARRGFPDIMGYLKLCGLPVPPHIAAAAKAVRYNARVFLAPFWDEIFTQDAERKQTRAEAEATCAAMRETYTELGYEITELLRADIVTRADFVCKQLAN